MLKRHELTDPNSCMSRARDGEMVFVLLERDDSAPGAIRWWVGDRIRRGKNKPGDPQMVEAEECARRMEAQRAEQQAARAAGE